MTKELLTRFVNASVYCNGIKINKDYFEIAKNHIKMLDK